jgi:quinol monooxygenase YgiN
MYGLIGSIRATPGSRDELASILAGIGSMPGCLTYIVATDSSSDDLVWVTEVWESREAHAASLELPGVQAAIAQGRPLIAGFDQRIETDPIGGSGLG